MELALLLASNTKPCQHIRELRPKNITSSWSWGFNNSITSTRLLQILNIYIYIYTSRSTLFLLKKTILPDRQPFSSSNASNLEMGEATDGNWGVDLLPPRPLTKNRLVEDGYIAVGGSEIRRSPVDMENISIIYRGLYIPCGAGFLPSTVAACIHMIEIFFLCI